MIPREFIYELLGRTDIVTVIDQYVPLKKAGANYVACCPFHNEKTPSFSVSPEKQFYHCFGCGVHGNAIDFLKDHLGLSFVDSVEKLASQAGLHVPKTKSDFSFEQRKENKKLEDSLKEINQYCAEFFYRQCHQNNYAEAYLLKRGLTQAVIDLYQIGYAPNSKNYLPQAVPGYQPKLLIDSGLLIEKEANQYARFRDRIMFPIRNLEGDVIGFGGRILEKGEPKYLNSPETILFDKSSCLYGLYEAKKSIRESGKVLVVEGYMDVVALSQHGMAYTVATLGTATTGQHIQILFRFTNQVYFCFDGDEAGRKAAWRALVNALEYLRDDKILYFVFLPEGQDPDSYVREFGKAAFEDFLEHKSIALSQYLISHLVANKDLAVGEIKAEVIKLAEPLFKKLKAASLRFMMLRQLAEHLGITAAELEELLGLSNQNIQTNKSYRQGFFTKVSNKPIQVKSYTKKMISWLLIYPKLASYIEVPDYLDFNEEIQCLLALADVVKINNTINSAAQLVELMKDSVYFDLVTQILKDSTMGGNEEVLDFSGVEDNFKQGVFRLKKEIIELEIKQLRDLMALRELTLTEQQLLMSLLGTLKN